MGSNVIETTKEMAASSLDFPRKLRCLANLAEKINIMNSQNDLQLRSEVYTHHDCKCHVNWGF